MNEQEVSYKYNFKEEKYIVLSMDEVEELMKNEYGIEEFNILEDMMSYKNSLLTFNLNDKYIENTIKNVEKYLENYKINGKLTDNFTIYDFLENLCMKKIIKPGKYLIWTDW